MNKKQRVLIIFAIILIPGTIGAVLGYYYADSLKSPVFNGDFGRNLNGNFTKDFNESSTPPPPREFNDEIDRARENFELYVSIKSAVTLINIVIAVILIGMYVKIYREVRSDFTLGLIVVMFALLVYAITSNPFVQYLFTFRGFGFGPFLSIPDICTTVAISVLLYLSWK